MQEKSGIEVRSRAAAPGVGRFALVCVLLCASSACSVKFAYNNVDRLVRWQMSDYLELDAAQRDYLQSQVAELMAWHRRHHLPLYAEYMQALSNQLSDGVTEQQIETIVEQMFMWGDEIQERGMPAAINLLSGLSDEQVAALPARLEKSNLELAEEDVDETPAAIQARWAEEMQDVIERFTGRLQREQRAYLARRASAYQPERILWADYRRRWQADMLALLARRADVAAFARDFRQLVASQESYYGDTYKRVSEDNIRLSREVTAYLLSNLNEKQSARLVESLRALAEDFTELAAQT